MGATPPSIAWKIEENDSSSEVKGERLTIATTIDGIPYSLRKLDFHFRDHHINSL